MSRNKIALVIGITAVVCLAVLSFDRFRIPREGDRSASVMPGRTVEGAATKESPGESRGTPGDKDPVSHEGIGRKRIEQRQSRSTNSIAGTIVSGTDSQAASLSAGAMKHAPVDPRVELAADRTKTSEERLRAILMMNQEGARIQFKEDLDSLSEILVDPTSEDTLRHEIALLLLRHDYEPLLDNVLAILNNPKEEARYRSFNVQHLWLLGQKAQGATRDKVMGTLRDLLNDKDVPVRREALLALTREGDPLGGTTALNWLSDTNAGAVHDLAIRYVREANLKDRTPRVREFLQSTNEAARIAALVTLSQWKDEQSRAAFEQATKTVNSVRVQRAGKAALERLGTP